MPEFFTVHEEDGTMMIYKTSKIIGFKTNYNHKQGFTCNDEFYVLYDLCGNVHNIEIDQAMWIFFMEVFDISGEI